MSIYPAGVQQTNSGLTGAERVVIDNGGAVIVTTTTQAIADLAGAGLTADITNTAITTAGAGTLTAAALVGGLITRTGPSAAYTDTTDTAANIVAALPEFVSGATFFIRIKNSTPYLETLAAGSGVTLPATAIVGPWQEANYYGVLGGTSGSPTVTLVHISTNAIGLAQGVVAPAAGSLTTVGAGTVTAALVNGGIVVRGGSQSNTAFADITDTADNIIAGNPGLVGKIGASFLLLYENTTDANCTLGGGTGVTVSGITVIPGKTWALYVVTYTAASTLTVVGIAASPPTAASGTFVCNGATPVTVTDSRITANSGVIVTLKTVGGTVGAVPAIKTITAGTGFTIAGTASDTSTYNYTIIG